MPTGSEIVRLLGKTGSGRRMVKVTRLTHLRHLACSASKAVVCYFSLVARSQSARLYVLHTVSSQGVHAAPRVHHTYRRRGSGVAA